MKEKWKRAYDIDPEAPTDSKRVEVSSHRKGWLIRAWSNFFGYVPNAIPAYNEKKGFFHTPAIHVNWHHITTQGESMRIYGETHEIYNDPRNLVPVSALNHVGDGADEDDFILHEDTQQAKKNYRGSSNGDSSYSQMGVDRRIMTSAGLIYHNDDYDTYLRDVADQVVSKYELEQPDDTY